MAKFSFPAEKDIKNKIYFIRGKKVMINKDISLLYGVKTKILNQTVKRNLERFPFDFMFKLTKGELILSRSQIVTLKQGKNIKYLPYAFTEHGISMLSSILKSKRAIAVNIQIIRAFIAYKRLNIDTKEILEKIAKLETRSDIHDKEIQILIRSIKDLVKENYHDKKKIGFCIN